MQSHTSAHDGVQRLLIWLRRAIWVLIWVPAWAHAAAAVSAAGVAAADKPVAILDVLARADDDQQRVDWARHLLSAPDPVGPLSATLDDIARPVNAKLNNSMVLQLRDLSVLRLESLARHWAFDDRRFEQWEVQAGQLFAPYADSALQLAQRRAAWTAARAEGKLDVLPPALRDHVDDVLAQLDATEADLSARLTRQFDLKRRASELKTRIQAGGNDVAAAIDDIDRRLMQTDAPPLWQGLGRADSVSAMGSFDRGLDIEEQFAIDYHAAGNGNQLALRVVQLLLLPLILWLFLRSRSASASPERSAASSTASPTARTAASPTGRPAGDRAVDQAATSRRITRALRRPFSTWLLLSMLAVLVLEPDAPQLILEFALLIALVPVLRLLPAGTLRPLGVWPYVAIALYAVDRLSVVMVGEGGLYRLFLLTLNALALVLTVLLLRHTAASATLDRSAVRRAIHATGWIVLGVLIAALGANIFGNVSLAEMLTRGVIDSGYMALMLYASVAACLGLLRALLCQPELINRRFVRRYSAVLERAVKRLLMLGALAGWLLYTVDRFRMLRPLRTAATAVMDVGIAVGEVSIQLGDVLVFVFSAWLAVWAARVVQRLLRDELPGHAGLPRGVGNSIASLSYYGVLLLGLLVALSAAGFKVSQLTLVFGALGVGIGFGLQSVVNNFVSGLVLMFERPIQPGDVVDAAGTSGSVREIGLRATTIRTFDGADVIVPNGVLLSGNLTNWTMFDRSRRIEILVGVAYGSDPATVLTVLGNVARATPGVAEQPEPVVLMTGYGDDALNFVVRVWTLDLSALGTLRGELLARMLAALDAAGISIPYRQVDVHVRSVPKPPDATAGEGMFNPGT
ncbi:mechanosensitive ion channel [Alcaligenaceae bacterium A4P071]|nr:mechanosensitive ion channel [Alcaligenaceae bacterium A4P071]